MNTASRSPQVNGTESRVTMGSSDMSCVHSHLHSTIPDDFGHAGIIDEEEEFARFVHRQCKSRKLEEKVELFASGNSTARQMNDTCTIL